MNETSSVSTGVSISGGSFAVLFLYIGSYCIFFVVAMLMFEVAVHFDWNRLFAPRSYARPIQVSILR
jgi:hypothetical protein